MRRHPLKAFVPALSLAALAMLTLALIATRPHADATETYNVPGSDVVVYDLAGKVDLQPASSGSVTVHVTRGGSDAAKLQIQSGTLGGHPTLRVMFPGDRIVYRGMGSGSHTTVHVRDDGTFGEDIGRIVTGLGRKVTVSADGVGTEAWADLAISVPKGQKLTLRLAAGPVTATNVDGQIVLDTSAGPVVARGAHGRLRIDTGSGDVRVADMQGDLSVDTGSGDVTLAGQRGEVTSLDTGSGRVTVSDARVEEIEVDTGSGDVVFDGLQASNIHVDTGSGSVDLDLSTDLEGLTIDTGSGDVRLTVPKTLGASYDIESSSGGIEIDVPHEATRIASDEARGRIGDGRGRIRIDTGSGRVQIRPRTSSGASLPNDLGIGVFTVRGFE